MFRSTVISVKRWVGRVVFRQNPIEQWSQLELERRIRKLERQKREFKEEMDEAKAEYDEKIREAETADETRIPEIKTEASRLLSKYEAIRSQWLETLVGLRFMQQAALGKQISANGPDALPSNMNPAQFERSTQSIERKVKDREERIGDWEIAASQLEDVSHGGSTHIDSMADERVEAAIDAAREGSKDVPTLEELADDSFSETKAVSPDPIEAEATDGPERF